MVDFISSYDAGLSAAKTAEENKQEIEQVFKELNKQLSTASNGTIFIDIDSFYTDNTIHGLSLAMIGQKRPTFSAILASNPKVKDSQRKELAKWDVDRKGYPCKINIGTKELYCEDKVALEDGLKQLLSDPVVGDTLYKISKLEVTNSTDSDNENN